jgi:hypothetical protein
VLGRRVGLCGVGPAETERVVDELPPVHVGPVDERDRHSGLPGTAGAPDAVHVRLLVVRALVVDDVGHVIDVDAAGGDVRGHEHVHLAVPERAQ